MYYTCTCAPEVRKRNIAVASLMAYEIYMLRTYENWINMLNTLFDVFIQFSYFGRTCDVRIKS